ncbi:hypothetical protein KFE25_004964 [Diacronema lutheri]|uniref:Cytochrome P450 n=1 Tax=Diacronema lutheri TaxID=2081491 RepID=A0A8J5XG42_DIALT|nr:hypothetical protein KFE25_004964 [Diacronema lutheri]
MTNLLQVAWALPVGLLAAAVVARLRFLRRLAHIPGPPHTFLLGNLTMMRGPPAFPFAFFPQRHLFLRALHARYGPVVRLVLPAGRGALVFFAKAEPMLEPFFKDSLAFPMRPSAPRVLERGLLAVPTGDVSRAHRAALSPALSTRALRHYTPALNRHASALCTHLAARAQGGHGDVEVHRPLSASTLDVIGEIGFGARFGALDGCEPGAAPSPFLGAANMLLSGVIAMVPWPLPVTRLVRALPLALQPRSQRELRGALRTYEGAARAFFAEASAAAAPTAGGAAAQLDGGSPAPSELPPRTFLEALAAARLSYAEAVDEIITLLLAGHETTANTLSWALHLLAAHPAEQAAARAELEAACPNGEPPNVDSLPKLTHLRGCVYEALRLFPTVPNVPRLCARDAIIGDVLVPAGTICFHAVAAGARDGSEFAEPDAFRPARHAHLPDGGSAAWLPFGAGPRKCIGYRLAELEAVTFLAALLRRFELLPPSAAAPLLGEHTDATLGPKLTGLHVRLKPRALVEGGLASRES